MDYTYIFLIMIFILWLYFLQLSMERKEKGFSYLQFVLSFPLMLFLGNSSYLSGFIFGYVFVITIGISSLLVLSANMMDLKNNKK